MHTSFSLCAIAVVLVSVCLRNGCLLPDLGTRGRLFCPAILLQVYERKVGSTQSDENTDGEGYHFVAVYASIASLIWYVYSFRMANKVGWQQSMMDVVHEVGCNTSNLNLYNVGVADSKQTCCHSAMAVHTSKKGHVFEATSACLHAAAEYIWEHLSLIEIVCTAHQFPLRNYFMLGDSFFPTTPPTTTMDTGGIVHVGIEPTDSAQRVHDDTCAINVLPHAKGLTVTLRMAFPVRPPGSPSYFPSVTPEFHYYGAVTDGDFTMWKRHILHVPARHFQMLILDPLKGMGVRYCDRHKGDRIRQSGKAAYKAQALIRRNNPKEYDKQHVLGVLLQRPWNANFEHLTEVVRAHPHPGVADLFLQIKARKARAMGLNVMQDGDEKKHTPCNALTGVYGQSSFLLRVSTAHSAAIVKSGMSFTANCLEAGPNKAAKTALGMQSSLSTILAKLRAACRKNTRDYADIKFSIRQDFVGQNPRNSNHKNQQMGEECTGDFFRQIWKDGQAKARNTAWVASHIYPASGSLSLTTNWADVCVNLPTFHGTKMAERMDAYLELQMTGEPGAEKIKQPHVKQNLPTYQGGHANNLRSNLKRWKQFDKDPTSYCDYDFFANSRVIEARRELADPQFLPNVSQTKTMTAAESHVAFEKYMLFWQHAYVRVTANRNVLLDDDSCESLQETWRFKRIHHGGASIFVPVDFGAYNCTCRQFAKYGFCEHCVIVGTLQRIGQNSHMPLHLLSLPHNVRLSIHLLFVFHIVVIAVAARLPLYC